MKRSKIVAAFPDGRLLNMLTAVASTETKGIQPDTDNL
jgi:hypothetical protein